MLLVRGLAMPYIQPAQRASSALGCILCLISSKPFKIPSPPAAHPGFFSNHRGTHPASRQAGWAPGSHKARAPCHQPCGAPSSSGDHLRAAVSPAVACAPHARGMADGFPSRHILELLALLSPWPKCSLNPIST